MMILHMCPTASQKRHAAINKFGGQLLVRVMSAPKNCEFRSGSNERSCFATCRWNTDGTTTAAGCKVCAILQRHNLVGVAVNDENRDAGFGYPREGIVIGITTCLATTPAGTERKREQLRCNEHHHASIPALDAPRRRIGLYSRIVDGLFSEEGQLETYSPKVVVIHEAPEKRIQNSSRRPENEAGCHY